MDEPPLVLKRGGNRAALHSHPLPLPPDSSTSSFLRSLVHRTATLLPEARLQRRCRGVWDAASRSVWVSDPDDVLALWRRGFFGKGSLSRSEPTWLNRERTRRGQKQRPSFVRFAHHD